VRQGDGAGWRPIPGAVWDGQAAATTDETSFILTDRRNAATPSVRRSLNVEPKRSCHPAGDEDRRLPNRARMVQETESLRKKPRNTDEMSTPAESSAELE
jgi:hypothetical protein